MKADDFRQLTKKQLAALYETHTTKEIADLYGFRSDESVRKRMVKLDIPRRNNRDRRTFTPDRDELHELYQQFSMKQIARKYGVGETVVWKRLKEFGITLKDFEDGGHRKKPGRSFSDKHRRNLSRARRGKWLGEHNPNWRGGLTAINLRLRTSVQYREWRQAALELRGNCCQGCGVADGFLCECCGTRIKLHVHHVESFARIPDKRFDPSNSEVLCPKCHHSRHRRK